MTYAYVVPGSGASACTWAFTNLKDTVQSVEHLERGQAGAAGRGQERGGGDAPWSVGFLWNLCGKVPFLRLEVTVRKRLAGGLVLPNYFALFLSQRTKVTSFCS